MAAAFYSRYVPPSAVSPEAHGGREAGVPQKRKREADVEQTTKTTKSSRVQRGENSGDISNNNNSIKKKKTKKKPRKGDGVETRGPSATDERRDEQSTVPWEDQPTNGQVLEKKASRRKTSTEGSADRTAAAGGSTDGPTNRLDLHKKTSPDPPAANGTTTGKKKHKKKKLEHNAIAAESEAPTKHAKILSKFERSQSKAEKLPPSESADDQEIRGHGEDKDNDRVSHGLEPLPQPAPAPQHRDLPTYATLPSWLAEPYSVSSSLKTDFKSLGVDSKLVSTLQTKGFGEAFPVQTAVISLLSRGPDYHEGDICISAATGSGKTLAYTIPLVAGIQYSPVSTLRGLIVVPTRELVKQARDTCEVCASGTGLRIGTAVGSTALKEEQQQLMGQTQVYDPVSYRARNEKSMTADDWTRFSLQDYLAAADDVQGTLPDHVHIPSPNVDILICTPGRLVDHIRSTKGFTLQHVQWLIVDEADRLLNESFQEWVETVMPAFDPPQNPAPGSAQSFLSQLGVSMVQPKLRKIILSATMTRDITKLNSLRLQNPKLVVMDDQRKQAVGNNNEETENHTMSSAGEDYNTRLPASLNEFYVPVGDGSEKPLYLLQLLLRHFNIDSTSPVTGTRRASSPSSTASSSPSDDDTSGDDSANSSTSTSPNLSTSSSTNPPTASDKKSALIFTKSSESAARLSRLLCLMHTPLSGRVGTLTKSNRSSSSRRTLSAYRQGTISIIVATDRASRGLDLPSLSSVISYDVPASVTSYIHRAGRTARAGREGSAWTLVAHREGRWFANEIVKGPIKRVSGERAVKKVHLQLEDGPEMRQMYTYALTELERQVEDSSIKPADREDRHPLECGAVSN